MRYVITGLTVLVCLTGCAIREQSQTTTVPPEALTTIKYTGEPFRTFEIAGTNRRCTKIEDLPELIRSHQKDNPGSFYELYAELKCVPETSDQIIATIKGTGVTLKHYWAPVSRSISTPGKYGRGHVDILAE